MKSKAMAETVHHKVMIIGSGPAGYTAAVYAARAMLEPGIVAGLQPGGQLTITTDVENYPGFPEILGPELMDKFKEHALKFGTAFYEDVILDVDFTTLVHRRDTLRAEKILQERLFNHEKIEILWNTTLEEIVGSEAPLSVTSVRLKNTQTGEEMTRNTHGVFIAIGHKPSTDIFKGHVEMNEGGYITTAPDSTATNIPGVFATGDVSDEVYRQAVTAAGLGCMGALEAERWLTEQAALDSQQEAAE